MAIATSYNVLSTKGKRKPRECDENGFSTRDSNLQHNPTIRRSKSDS